MRAVIKPGNKDGNSQAEKAKGSRATESSLSPELAQQKRFFSGGGSPRAKPSGKLLLKSKLSRPGDRLEQEADRVAERITNMQPHNINTGSAEKTDIQSQPTTRAQSSVAGVNLTQGKPLSVGEQSYFEPRFGRDFSQVRIHSNRDAASSAQALQARAFTSGNNIVFAAKQYDPGTPSGNRLLAHELVHVVQSGIAAGNRWATHETNAGAHIAETMASGLIARDPVVLESPDTATYSTAELDAEIEAILARLSALPEVSSAEVAAERSRLEERYFILDAELQGRRRGGREAADAATAAIIASGADLQTRISMAFGAGFAAGALMEYRPADAPRLMAEIEAHPWHFGGGILLGIPQGALSDLWSNIVGIAELAMYLSPTYWAYRSISETLECLSDVDVCAARAANERAQAQALLIGLGELIVEVARDPNFLVRNGEELGIVAGQRVAQWFSDDFMHRSTYEKGETVGIVIGTIIMEIALLFLGPEEWIARGVAAGGQVLRVSARLERALVHLMERVPSLARLMELRRAAEGAHLLDEAGDAARVVDHVRDAERAGETAADVERAVTAAPPVEVPAASPPAPPVTASPPPSPPRRRLGPAHADSSGVTFSEPHVPTPETRRRPRITVDEPRVPDAPARPTEPAPHPFDEELHPSADTLDDIADGIADVPDVPQSGSMIDPGAPTIDSPVGSPRAGALSGDLGEATEAAASGARSLPRRYSRHVSRATRDELRRIFSEFGDDALRVFVERLGLPPGGLSQVEIPVARAASAGRRASTETRRVDRLFVEGSEIVLREVKHYPRATLRGTASIERELTDDLAILARYPYARVDWHITGNIHSSFLARLQALEASMGGRFRLIRGPSFNVIP